MTKQYGFRLDCISPFQRQRTLFQALLAFLFVGMLACGDTTDPIPDGGGNDSGQNDGSTDGGDDDGGGIPLLDSGTGDDGGECVAQLTVAEVCAPEQGGGDKCGVHKDDCFDDVRCQACDASEETCPQGKFGCPDGQACDFESHICVTPVDPCEDRCGKRRDACGQLYECDACGDGFECDFQTQTCVACTFDTSTSEGIDEACSTLSVECGFSDFGCGPSANSDCGGCEVGYVCNQSLLNLCQPACSPPSGASAIQAYCDSLPDVECGVTDDGCGGWLDCGSCTGEGETCGAGGIENVCAVPEAAPQCETVGAECGDIESGCPEEGQPVRMIDCGECDPGIACVDNKCACEEATCETLELCGSDLDDSCGGTVDCDCEDAGDICSSAVAGEGGSCVERKTCDSFGADGTLDAICSNDPSFDPGNAVLVACGCGSGLACYMEDNTPQSGAIDRGSCCDNDPCNDANLVLDENCEATNQCTGQKVQCCGGNQFCWVQGSEGQCKDELTCGELGGNEFAPGHPDVGGAGQPCSRAAYFDNQGSWPPTSNVLTCDCSGNYRCSSYDGGATAGALVTGANEGTCCDNSQDWCSIGSWNTQCQATNMCTGATVDCCTGADENCDNGVCESVGGCDDLTTLNGSHPAVQGQGERCSNSNAFDQDADWLPNDQDLTCRCSNSSRYACSMNVGSSPIDVASGTEIGTCCDNNPAVSGTSSCDDAAGWNPATCTATNECTGQTVDCCPAGTECNGSGQCIDPCDLRGADGSLGSQCSNGPAWDADPGVPGNDLTCPCSSGVCSSYSGGSTWGTVVSGAQIGTCCTSNGCSHGLIPLNSACQGRDMCTGALEPSSSDTNGCCNSNDFCDSGVCRDNWSCSTNPGHPQQQLLPTSRNAGDDCARSRNPLFPRYPADTLGNYCNCRSGQGVCSKNGALVSTSSSVPAADRIGTCCLNTGSCAGNVCEYTNTCTGSTVNCCGSGEFCNSSDQCQTAFVCSDLSGWTGGAIGSDCFINAWVDDDTRTTSCSCVTTGGRDNNYCDTSSGNTEENPGTCVCSSRTCTGGGFYNCALDGLSDYCGGTLDCDCGSGEVCNPNTDQCCTPQNPPGCPGTGVEGELCGTHPDGCGGSVACGSCINTGTIQGGLCIGGPVCNNQCEGGVCRCTPLNEAAVCAGRIGDFSDGCGGLYSCGEG